MSQRVLTQTFCVVGAIIEKDGKIALVQEGSHTKGDSGKWSHPAGWLDVGENLVVGVKREVEEETGFTFTPTAILGVYSLVRQDLTDPVRGTPHAIKIIFIGEADFSNQQKQFDDVSDLKWFTPEEIYAMDAKTLRDVDIKQMVKDYFNGQKFPLDIIQHTVQTEG
ncbi:MAG: NUDIX domain-containing protein [Candidatus Komeilibacteria bacterium]|nr:NUDIX domain-containing protein [Candidatus Komeilibacteria bacterium]